MDLYIAEKNTLAETLCTFLSKGERYRKDKHAFYGKDYVMTACMGHTMELCDASEYEDKWCGPWTIESLPILPQQMKYRPIDRQSSRLRSILNLCTKATRIIHCGDPDREGQYLVDIVIANSGFKGEVYRWWPDDLSQAGLERSHRQIKHNSNYESLGIAAKYRAWADWIVGINYTRLFTLSAKAAGHTDTISIGRVQTPTFSLVHQRCIDIETFKPTLHYGLAVNFSTSDGETYQGSLVLPDDISDSNGRCLDVSRIQQIKDTVSTEVGEVTEFENNLKETTSPLPYSLSSLQEAASKQWGYTLKETLSAVQFLYEEMQVLTYPRTDCRYLSEGDFCTSKSRIEAISKQINILGLENMLSLVKMPRCFNDKKTTAHTAIIPTTNRFKLEAYTKLSASEKKKRNIPSEHVLLNIYEMCSKRFLQQFMPPKIDNTIRATTQVKEYEFRTNESNEVEKGWKQLEYTNQKDRQDNEKKTSNTNLNLRVGEKAEVKQSEIKSKKTTPPEHFTEGTLATAMANIAAFVTDPEIKKRLKETDGIGTEATRTSIVERLKTIGVISSVNGKLISTSLGRKIYPAIPTYFKNPSMTAIWESALNGVAEGRVDHNTFHKNVCAWTERNIGNLKQVPPPFDLISNSSYKCKSCESVVVKQKGRYGAYWECANNECREKYSDYKKQPLFPIKGHGDACPSCKGKGIEGIMKTKATKGNLKEGKQPKAFLGCSNYPDCKETIWDTNI